MTIYLHLVRHAQGFHNLSAANQQLPDPDLTPLGESQCAALRDAFPYHADLRYLVASTKRLPSSHNKHPSRTGNIKQPSRRLCRRCGNPVLRK